MDRAIITVILNLNITFGRIHTPKTSRIQNNNTSSSITSRSSHMGLRTSFWDRAMIWGMEPPEIRFVTALAAILWDGKSS